MHIFREAKNYIVFYRSGHGRRKSVEVGGSRAIFNSFPSMQRHRAKRLPLEGDKLPGALRWGTQKIEKNFSDLAHYFSERAQIYK